MRKALLVIFLVSSMSVFAQSEIFYVGNATANEFVISANETVSINGLVLKPTSSFNLSNNGLTYATTATHTVANGNTYVNKVYKFTYTTPAFAGTIVFDYTGLTPITDKNALRMHYHDGTSWQYFATNVANNTTTNLLEGGTFATNNTLSEITLAEINNRPLPVVWLNFTSENKNNKFVVLKWSTASEINTKDFLVQHSIDGISWNNIGTVAAKGNSASVSDYTLTHFAPVQGNNFYRLQQRDLDGKSSYSKILNEFLAGDIPTLSLYPNPVISSNVSIQSSKNLSAVIYSLTGKKIWNGTISAGVNKISVEGWAKGVYFVKTTDQTLQFVIQ